MSSYELGTKAALSSVMKGKNTFITGSGGSGKSHTIRTMQDFFEDDTIFCGPTGISALNIRGSSCHKTFGLAMGVSLEDDLRRVKSRKQAALLSSRALSRIVIDEVGMVRTDKLYEMDHKMRYFRKNDLPFGGLQVVALGDGFQIPPVLRREEKSVFHKIYGSEIPFGSPTWKALNFTNVLLNKNYRQKDAEFMHHLNNIRTGVNVYDAVQYFNDNCYGQPPSDAYVTLCSTNKLASEVNQERFNLLAGKSKQYRASIKGDFKERPVEEIMSLKIGCKVMVIKNDSETPPRYVNGSVGIVKSMAATYIVVEINGNPVEIAMHTWDNVGYETSKKKVVEDDECGVPVQKEIEVIKEVKLGSYVALPVKLGYAITTHKAQGLTLAGVNIDLGAGAFAAGMTYVALSRATNVQTLTLTQPLRAKDIIVDRRIVDFYRRTFPNMNQDLIDGNKGD